MCGPVPHKHWQHKARTSRTGPRRRCQATAMSVRACVSARASSRDLGPRDATSLSQAAEARHDHQLELFVCLSTDFHPPYPFLCCAVLCVCEAEHENACMVREGFRHTHSARCVAKTMAAAAAAAGLRRLWRNITTAKPRCQLKGSYYYGKAPLFGPYTNSASLEVCLCASECVSVSLCPCV